MRDKFSGYYRPSKEEFALLWKDCIFVLDANVLLNLYRYPKKAKEELLTTLSSVKGRIWLPFQAAFEYQRNRPRVIAQQKKRFHEVQKIVGGIISNLEGEFGKLQLKDRHALIEPEEFINKMRPIVDEFRQELQKLEEVQANVHDDDPIRKEIDDLMGKNIGDAFNATQIKEICEEGDKRFEWCIPPGFMDSDKAGKDQHTYGGITYEAKFGDLVLWKQILEFAKKKKKPAIILLTDDEKKDWWWQIDSLGEQTIGPRPELVEEIKREADVTSFYIYSSEQFLKFSRDHLDASVSDESIEQVRETAERSRAAPPHRDYINQARFAEQVVCNWLRSKYGAENVLENRGWPDFTVVDALNDRPLGVEVLHLRNAFGPAFFRLRERMYRAFHDVSVGSFSRFEMVIVVQETEIVDRIQSDIERGRFDLLSGVSLTVGLIEEGSKSNEPIFLPHYSCNQNDQD